ncbi:hypothetical protein TrCOL_g13373 [Triparma columacea]|uniref:Uncharacterized protein n=1 Tax=Triparma columacea TaxID=722753 RepID=A0A9W7G5Q5_9STRA|nr:hypothetical protein TrCOL_g13373 [Triparma columacea]
MPCCKVTATTVAKLIAVSACVNLLDGVGDFLGLSFSVFHAVGFLGHLSSIWLLHKFKTDEAVAPFRKRLKVIVCVTVLSVIYDIVSMAVPMAGSASLRVLRLLVGLPKALVFGYFLWMSYWIHAAVRVQNKELLYSLLPGGDSSPAVSPHRNEEKDEEETTETIEMTELGTAK